MSNLFRKQWLKTTVDARNEDYDKIIEMQNEMINDALDALDVSEVLGMLDEIMDCDDETAQLVKRLYKMYASMLKKYLELSSLSYDIIIDQDNRIRHIEEQNDEIIKLLKKEKTTK